MDQEEARLDFKRRMEFLESEYEPFNDDSLPYCQVVNMGQKVLKRGL